MKYGKIENGDVVFAPKQFIENGKQVIGFTETFLRSRGYKPVVFTAPPETEEEIAPVVEVGGYISEWEDTGEQIVQKWVEVDTSVL